MNSISVGKSIALLIFLFFISCGTDLKPLPPQYNKPLESVISDISKLTSFTKMEITSKFKNSTGSNPSNELIFELTNATILTYTTNDLDLLSRKIALNLKKSISNFNSYDWVTVAYLTDDGSPASDSTTQYGYVYRPADIK